MPFFSVIIPTHNRASLLQRAVNSVLEQSFTDYEIIIVDDQSTDNTENIVRNMNNAKISYYKNERTRGSAGAKNTGIQRAKGEWIALLDDDDVWFRDKLQIQYEKIRNSGKETVLIYTASVDDLKGRIICRPEPEKKGYIFTDLLSNDYIGTASSVVFRKTAFNMVGGYDERFPGKNDRELYIRLSREFKIDFINQVLVKRDLSSENRISKSTRKKFIANVLFYEKYRKYYNRYPEKRHRIMTSIFANAFCEGKWKEVFRAFPGTVLGVLEDGRRLKYILRKIYNYIKDNYAKRK